MTAGISGTALARQFARAVLADQLIADELTRLALIELKYRGESPVDDAAALLGAILSIWRGAAGATPAPFSTRALLASVPPPPDTHRMMVLLVDVLGLSALEAAKTLVVGSEHAEDLLNEGRSKLTLARQVSAIIVEDEPLIAAELAEILREMGVTVAGSAKNMSDAITLAQTATPDLVLADYNLEDTASGGEIVDAIRSFHDCRVIFITGFPEQVLGGDIAEPDFVIAKPYGMNAVKAAVAQCADNMASAALGEK